MSEVTPKILPIPFHSPSEKHPQPIILIADLPQSDYKWLGDEGVIPMENPICWNSSERANSGFHVLLSELGVSCDADSAVIDVPTHAVKEATNLRDYFLKFIKETSSSIPSVIEDCHKGSSRVLVINLLPFFSGTTRVDQVLQGLFSEETKAILEQFTQLVFLIRNIDWILKSRHFQEILNDSKLPCETFVVDLRCFGAKFTLDNNRHNFRITRKGFELTLNISESRIYRSLIKETNSHIGHFILRNSHVRTHYYLDEFVNRDNVWEYLGKKIITLLGNAKRIFIAGTGMEHRVIRRLGEGLVVLLGEDYHLEFAHYPLESPELVVPRDWTSRFDMAIVLGDIVCSGTSIASWIDELKKLNLNNKPIKAFAVASMNNSPPDIMGIPLVSGVKIKRVYFQPAPDKCNLCALNQPAKEVNKAGDFRHVAREQLTPYDFWEIVADAKALTKNRTDLQGRHFRYRIDTEKILARYGYWLRNVVKDKYNENWPGVKPDFILTVKEQSGLAFAKLVQEVLEVPNMFAVERLSLNKVTPGGGLPEDSGNSNPLATADGVLVVDDGINYGRTMSNLLLYCHAAGKTPIGGLVLDSRLNEHNSNRMLHKTGGGKVIALYRWPSETSSL